MEPKPQKLQLWGGFFNNQSIKGYITQNAMVWMAKKIQLNGITFAGWG